MRWSDVVTLAMQWPDLSESTSYGTPSLKVRRRLLARHRPEDDSVVLPGIPVEERGHLIEVMPDAFFCEPHYEGYDIVLAWLPPAPPDIIGRFLERRWRSAATKRALASFDA